MTVSCFWTIERCCWLGGSRKEGLGTEAVPQKTARALDRPCERIISTIRKGQKGSRKKGEGTADLGAEEVVAVGGHFDAIDGGGGGGGGGTAGGVVSSGDGIKLEAILQANERVQKKRVSQIHSLVAPSFRSSLLWEK